MALNKKFVGTSLDDFLAEQGMLEEATATAVKRVIAWQIKSEKKSKKLTGTTLTKRCIPAERQ